MKRILGRKKAKEDVATARREELRSELSGLRADADKLRDESDELREEIDHWRDRYYSLVSSIATGNLQEALDKIKGH